MTGAWPLLIMSTFAGFASTPITSWPSCARHAPETHPTYPRPKIAILTPHLTVYEAADRTRSGRRRRPSRSDDCASSPTSPVRDRVNAVLESLEHLHNRRVPQNIGPCISPELMPQVVVSEQLQNPTAKFVHVALRNHVSVPAVDQVVDLWGMAPGLGYDRQGPVEGLVEPEARVAGDREEIGHLENLADPDVARIVNLAKVDRVPRIQRAQRLGAHARTHNDQAGTRRVDLPEDLDEVPDVLSAAAPVHPADRQHHLGERDSRLALDLGLRLANVGV